MLHHGTLAPAVLAPPQSLAAVRMRVRAGLGQPLPSPARRANHPRLNGGPHHSLAGPGPPSPAHLPHLVDLKDIIDIRYTGG